MTDQYETRHKELHDISKHNILSLILAATSPSYRFLQILYTTVLSRDKQVIPFPIFVEI